MIKIKELNPKRGADYELEDGTILWEQDWNGEVYSDDGSVRYRPVMKEIAWEDDGEPYQWDIVGFEKD